MGILQSKDPQVLIDKVLAGSERLEEVSSFVKKNFNRKKVSVSLMQELSESMGIPAIPITQDNVYFD